MSKHNFEELLLEAIDEGLSSLGDSAKQALYFHLEKSFDVKKEEIPYKPGIFAEAIEKILGLGASFVEILIMKRLYEKIGGVFEWHESNEFVFSDYVTVAKRSFIEKKRKMKVKEGLVECEEIGIEI